MGYEKENWFPSRMKVGLVQSVEGHKNKNRGVSQKKEEDTLRDWALEKSCLSFPACTSNLASTIMWTNSLK